MVSKRVALVASLLSLALFVGCELFTTSPFPGFVDQTDISIDLGSRINSITGGASPVTYDLNVVDQAGLSPRVLLLAEPPSSDPTQGFDYKGQLIFMDQSLNVLGQAATGSPLDFFSKPYAYSADSNNDILAGYFVLSPNGATTTVVAGGTKLTPLGLVGFAFNDGVATYVFATPPGQYASFDLSVAAYNSGWGLLYTGNGVRTLAIIPQAARPSPSDPNYTNLGYQLVGLAYDQASGYITFVFSEPAQGRIEAARLDLATATSGTGVLLPNPTSWPVGADAWPVALTEDRPQLHADAAGIFMVQRDGWMTRYTWTAPSQALAWTGSPVQIVGDRSLSRLYAFLLPQSGGPQYMYRFDPASRILTRYKRWW